MNLYSRDFFGDDELIAEIKAYAKMKRDVVSGEVASKIQGEGRLVEFVRGNSGDLDTAIRAMLYEARQRGLSIGGDPDYALLVEIY